MYMIQLPLDQIDKIMDTVNNNRIVLCDINTRLNPIMSLVLVHQMFNAGYICLIDMIAWRVIGRYNLDKNEGNMFSSRDVTFTSRGCIVYKCDEFHNTIMLDEFRQIRYKEESYDELMGEFIYSIGLEHRLWMMERFDINTTSLSLTQKGAKDMREELNMNIDRNIREYLNK